MKGFVFVCLKGGKAPLAVKAGAAAAVCCQNFEKELRKNLHIQLFWSTITTQELIDSWRIFYYLWNLVGAMADLAKLARMLVSRFHVSREPLRTSSELKPTETCLHSLLWPVCLCFSQILELTLLMASYMNHWNPSVPPASHQPPSHWDGDSRHFPAMNYTTKGPTLLWTKTCLGVKLYCRY